MTFLLITLAVVLTIALLLWLFTFHTARRVELALPPEGRFVAVGGSNLHVLDVGQGPSVLLIHGLSGHLKHFSYGVMAQLAKDYRVVALDRPGSGYSSPAATADLETQADIVSGLIDALDLGKPLIVGHSLGGALALTLALRHPQQAAGLALIAPLTHLPGAPSKAFSALTIRQDWLRHLVAWTLAVPLMIIGRKLTVDIVFGPEPFPRNFPFKGGGMLGLRPSHFVAASRDLNAIPLSLPAQQLRYASLRLPVSILYGRQDRILDPEFHGTSLANIVPGAELQWVDGGHMLPVTQPEVTAAFIRKAAQRSAEVPAAQPA
ncbi:alpha/beta fold hydrolase [Pseudomonas sp. PDM14]|uniref:alpha/beta fold hydrolase n=1 Tax=Pseudomonas sp. PDM14 TaxID=2769288 RepID=UPI00177B998F|nr:alpha/beta fold hydrolase [Pseudomonas sp. PDM14]MBD9482568.1 alpha/beta fold hydrolase [Pseudomonas sp. PDM14]